jgi:O-antigen/teichoic acid export membrane protein
VAEPVSSDSSARGFLKRAAGALLAYAGAKASVLAAPLLLSTRLPLSEYGLVEYSLSVGQLVSVCLAAGIHVSVPYFLLKRGQSVYAPAFAAHLTAVCSGCVLVSLLAAMTGLATLRLVMLMAGVAVTQYLTAAKYRTLGRPMESSLAESSQYLLLLAFGVAASLHLFSARVETLATLLTVYLTLVIAWNLLRFPWRTTPLRLLRTYREAARYGISTIPASLANVGLVSLGRVLIGVVGTLDQVAIYGVVYRLCAPIVAIHQFLANLFFKRLYESNTRTFERYFAALSAVLIGAAVLAVVMGPWVGQHLIGSKAVPIGTRIDLFILMSCPMVLWSQLSLMELFLNREGRSIKQLPGFVAGCAVGALCLLLPGWRGADPVDDVVFFQGLGLTVAVLWQLHASGVPRPRWPLARAIVLGQAVVLCAGWLLAALGGLRTIFVS